MKIGIYVEKRAIAGFKGFAFKILGAARLFIAHITASVEERTSVLLRHSDVMGQVVRVFTLLKRGRTNSVCRRGHASSLDTCAGLGNPGLTTVDAHSG